MTKQQEIESLDRFIARLGDASYLGPWLKEHRAEIVADIHNDVPVDILMPKQARAKAEQILVDARQEADVITTNAKKAAQSLRDRVEQDLKTSRDSMAEKLETLARQLRRGPHYDRWDSSD